MNGRRPQANFQGRRVRSEIVRSERGEAGNGRRSLVPLYSSSSARDWGVSWLFAPALGAAAIFQVVVVPKLAMHGVYPDLILLLVIAKSLLAGRQDAVMWGFVGGLWMDVLSGGAMGASSLALMVAALLTGIGHKAIFRRHFFVPFIAALSGSLVFSFVYVAILTVVGYRFQPDLLITKLVVPVCLYNGAIMFLATPLLNRLPEKAGYP